MYKICPQKGGGRPTPSTPPPSYAPVQYSDFLRMYNKNNNLYVDLLG